jgi:hypothetical protein
MKAEIEDEFEIEVKIENEIGTERSRQEFLFHDTVSPAKIYARLF